jgi:drug/metabolite transporter (DMT)-like permease
MTQNLAINGRSAATTMVAAMAVIGVIDNYIAVISRDVSIWQYMLVRGAIALPIIVVLSFLGLGTMRPIRTWAVGPRSLLIAISMLFYFGSLSFMPITRGLAGLFTSPIFIFQKSGLKPPTSVGKDPIVHRRRSIPLNPSTLVGGGSV